MNTATTTPIPPGEQLELLPAEHIPTRFRLDRQTRLRGLAHVAEIRRMLQQRAGEPPDPGHPAAGQRAA
jgi:hypothetical protein